ncbi:hypothetical protein [Roseateles sp.]|uniref:hypothetical protein n=1 Tax=Roseateles sp. TaxID=1971397 RepID=UPI002E0C2626|nr:hypothetical protein [Roseateles sp.]
MAKLSELGLGQSIFRCTHQKCQELFIGNYKLLDRAEGGRPAYSLQSVAPVKAQSVIFPDTVVTTSPTFAMVFNQSVAAESAGLDQLVGIGLRKALEFLIKDYAILEQPEKTDEIRSTQLAACISSYVSDPNVKECAKRAAWLGNDETHYTRKWEAKDVNDLKLLVKLTVNWIDNALLTKKYIAEMSAGKS